jgi:hypothetical protein
MLKSKNGKLGCLLMIINCQESITSGLYIESILKQRVFFIFFKVTLVVYLMFLSSSFIFTKRHCLMGVLSSDR